MSTQLTNYWPKVLAGVRAGAEAGLELAGDKMKFEVAGELYKTKTGRTYNRDGRTHRASAPGETFASDTKRLEQSIEVEPDGELIMAIYPTVPYAMALEFGSIRMAARPTWLPVGLRLGGNGGQVVQIIGNEIIRRVR